MDVLTIKLDNDEYCRIPDWSRYSFEYKMYWRGVLLPHPNGIVIHPDSNIGPNCFIFQQVTLTGGVSLGYHVDIGAGAKILDPVTIGNNVRTGANAVVTKDIPSGCTVAGIPAKPL